MQYTIMSPSGIVAGTVTADNAEAACEIAEKRGYEVIDVMDDILVIKGE